MILLVFVLFMPNGLFRASHLCNKESTASRVYAPLRSLQNTHPPDELQPLMTNSHNPVITLYHAAVTVSIKGIEISGSRSPES